MKTCVITESFSCDPVKLWLYLAKPTLNGWCKEVRGYEEDSDGMRAVERHADGKEVQLQFTRREKGRCLSCTFQSGKISGSFTAILFGGGDSTTLEGTLEIQGLGLFAKPIKLLEARMTQLHSALGA